MTKHDTSETHDVNVCGCRECDIIRWEYWVEKGE